MIPGVAKICLDCGKLTHHGNRCETCQLIKQKQMTAARGKRKKYNGNHKTKAAHIVATATNCHICGEGPRENDPFQADHIIENQYDSPLAAAHRSCNIKKYHAWKRQQKTET